MVLQRLVSDRKMKESPSRFHKVYFVVKVSFTKIVPIKSKLYHSTI